MPKKYQFKDSDVLTKESMNSLVQTCQLSSTLTPNLSDTETTDKLVPTVQLLNTVVNSTQTFNGTKTFTGNLRMGTNSGGKINFGDGDFVYLHENSDDNLTIRASVLNLSANTINLSGTGRISASQISYSNPNSYFGGATNVQAVLDYIASVFNGVKVTKITASNIEVN